MVKRERKKEREREREREGGRGRGGGGGRGAAKEAFKKNPKKPVTREKNICSNAPTTFLLPHLLRLLFFFESTRSMLLLQHEQIRAQQIVIIISKALDPGHPSYNMVLHE